jgi:hypothetical protein
MIVWARRRKHSVGWVRIIFLLTSCEVLMTPVDRGGFDGNTLVQYSPGMVRAQVPTTSSTTYRITCKTRTSRQPSISQTPKAIISICEPPTWLTNRSLFTLTRGVLQSQSTAHLQRSTSSNSSSMSQRPVFDLGVSAAAYQPSPVSTPSRIVNYRPSTSSKATSPFGNSFNSSTLSSSSILMSSPLAAYGGRHSQVAVRE